MPNKLTEKTSSKQSVRQIFSKIWSILLFLATIGWFVDIVNVLMGHKNFDSFTLIVAFLITGGCTLKWAIEAWKDEWI